VIATWWSSKRATSAGLVGALSGAMLLTGLPVAPVAPASASSTPAHVSFKTQPGGGSPGSPLSAMPKVHVTDNGSPAAAVEGADVTLTLDVVFPADQPTSPPALTCDLMKVTTNSSGDAAFTGCKVSRAGRYKLTATVSGLTVQSSSFDISGLSQLAFTSAPPTTATAGEAWGSQPVVTMQTTAGDTVDSTDHIGLLVTTTGGSFSPLTCTQNPVVADHGVATFAGCKINAAGSGYTLRAVDINPDTDPDIDPEPDLLGAPSAALTITAGAPTQLVFTHQPSGGPGGTAFAVQPVVTAQDAGGNPVPGYNDNVTLSIGSGASVSGVALTCAHNPVAAVNGVATFAGCNINKAHTGYTLTAHVNAPSLTATSTSFGITAGAASGIAFGTAPDGAHGGIAFTTQPVVNLTDSGGNPVNGTVTLSLDASTNSEGATLTCVATTLGTTNGHADFSGCKIDKNGTYQLTATSGTASVNTANLLVSEGSASQLVFNTTPSGGTGGTAFGTQPSVDVKDSGGNPASGDVTLSIAAGTGTPGATLHCASNPEAPNGAGRATFGGCKIDKAGLGYRLTATVAGTVTVTSDAFDVAVGSAAKIAFTAQPGGGAGGEAWEHQPAVSIEDAGGNLVSTSSATVTLTRTSGQGSGVLTCKDAAVPAQHGVARFNDCAIDRAGTRYTLDASASLGSATSDPFDITTGSPAALRFTTQPGAAMAGSEFGTQPVVKVVDRGGNTTGSSANIGLSLTPGTGTAGAGLSCSSQAADQGTATFSGCSIDQAGGGYVLTATDSADHLTAESGNLSVLLPPPSPLGQAPTPLPLGQTFGGRIYGDNPTATTDKVNTATGALAFSSTDVSVAGLGEPFVLDRSYNSLDATGGAFGRGWSSIFDISVKVVPGQTETVRGEDGQQLVWRFNPATNSWVAPPGAHAQLTCGAKTCKLIRDDNVRWDVNLTANGRAQLVDYQAPDGQGLKFAWTTSSVNVTLAGAKTAAITAQLNAAGQVTRIDTPTRHVSYTYSSAGLLTSVTDVLGNTWLYGYDGSGKLTTITDPTGATRLAAAYDGNSKVGSLQISGDQQRSDTTFTYDTSPQATTRHVLSSVAGAAPTRQDYVDRYVGNVLVAQSMPSGATVQYSYDANLRLIESQDALGWTSTYTYDGSGNLTSQTVPVSSTRAATVRMQYDGQHRITSQTDATGNTTTYSYSGPWLSAIKPPANGNVQWTRFDYDGVGHLVDTVGPTNKRVFSYDAHGNMTNVVIQDLAGKTLNGAGTTFTYDEAGNRLTSIDPLGHETTWTYDAAGHQTKSVPALGNATTNTFNAAGDPSSTTDAAGHTTEWSWNGSAGTRTTAVDHVTTLVQTYDPAGNLLRENPGAPTDPGTTYTYDASGRQLTKTDAAGITTHYSYDLNSNVVAADDTSGQVLTQSFNALGKLVRRTANGRVTSVTYDLAGNVASSTDAAGNATSYTYNPDSLVASAHNTAGTTSYSYDSAGNLVSVLDPVGHTTAYAYDALARRTKATEGGGSTTYAYDADNSLISSTDPDGRKTAYTLDALHRVTSTTYSQPGQPSITVGQTYDALGRRKTMTDTSVHTYTYDANGNLASANGFSYDWSQPGKIVETYPDTKTVTYALDDHQKLMSVTSGTKGQDDYVSASYLRNAQRQTVGIAFANGVLDTRLLNQSGDVLRQSLTLGGKPAAVDAFTYDSAGNPLSQVNNVNGNVTTNRYGYDGDGRLIAQSQSATTAGGTAWPDVPNLDSSNDSSAATTAATFAPTVDTTPPAPPAGAPPAQNISYDGNGNRTSISTGGGTTTSALNAFDQVTSQAGSSPASYTYDKSGNMLTATRAGQATSYAYDAAGRLVRVSPPAGGDITYTYDGDGNRTSRTQGGTTTQLVWDPANDQPQLALEKVGGQTVRRYIYGEGPVAMQVPGAGGTTATYFYQLDPQGNVTELTNADGSLAAVYRYDGFGNVTMDAGGDGHGNPLLFKSEYLDQGSQLYYMKARNYDATTGRFTQRDPKDPAVGAAVMTPYAFASDRPTSLSDPKGASPETDKVFWSHSTDEANIGNDVKLGLSGVAVTIKGGMKLSTLLGSKTVTATESLASSVGAEARVASAGARELGSAEGAVAGAAKEAGAAGEALGGAAKAAKFAGTALAIAGIGLQAFITVEDCMHDTAYVCAADVVGLTISIAVTIGCEFVSAGAATVACALIGGALAVAIPMLITEFGPQAVAGIIQGYNIVAGAVEAAIPIVAAAINTAIDAAVTFAEDVGGAIVSGFNQGVAAVTSGFWSAVDTLRDAGYTAGQLAVTLANAFAEGVSAAVSTLVDFGYQVGEIAQALFDELGQTLTQAVQLLKDTFNYTVGAIADALQSAYSATVNVLASALKAAQYAVDEVVTGLKAAYTALATAGQAAYEGIIRALNAVNYGINQIAGALQDVYNAIDTAVTTAFHTVVTAVTDAINYTVDEVAGALKTVFNDTAQLAIQAFEAAGYLVDQAAKALDEVFHTAAALAAEILDSVSYALNGIADALNHVWNQLDTQVAQIFQTLSKTAEQVVGALNHAFGDLADAAALALEQAGYLAQEAMAAISDAFNTAIDLMASYFKAAGYVLNDIADALHSVFSETAAAIITVLEGLYDDLNAIATSIADAFSYGAAEIAQAFSDAAATIAQITGIMKDAFAVASDAIAGILTDVQNLARDAAAFTINAITSVLESIYQLGDDIIAGLLKLAGWGLDAINAIGDAFASFGQSIADGFSDAWDTISSWF
jgi:RHS repeat-associated protein